MASNQDFIFTLGADITPFTKSITQVEAELKSVRDSLKNKTGQAIVQTNQYIAQLESSLVNLRKAGLDKLPGAAGAGSAALFSLSQVARDAPFGFIAIQNNLPLVVDQFTQLSKTSGGLGNALKQVGASLIGPAGIAFAFGAVISVVTTLVQKYGSLGEAFNQILGITPKLTAAQKEYNQASIEAGKNTIEESAKIDILVKRLSDLKLPAQERIAAYYELKKVAPDVVAGIREENALTAASIELIKSNVLARKELIKFEIQEAGIKAALTKNEETLANKRLELINLENRKLHDALPIYDARRRKEQGKATAESVLAEALALKSLESSITGVNTEITDLTSEQEKFFTQLDPIVNGITNINEATRKRIEGLKQQIEEEKKAKQSAKELNDERLRGLKKELSNISGDFGELETLRKRAEEEINIKNIRANALKAYDKYVAKRKEDVALSNKLYTTITKTTGEPITWDKETRKLSGYTTQLIAAGDAIDNFKNFKPITVEDFIKPEILQKNKEYTEAIKKQYESVRSTIEQALSAPLDYIFNTLLEGGKLSWKEFGKVVLKVLANIVSAIIATTAAAAIANRIVPGAGTAAVNAYNAGSSIFGSGGRQISPSLGYTPRGLPGRTSAVNFGGLSGGLGMSGQVVFVQRGSDLVGVLNRSNATINRVG
jgi:type IV secretory pathway VirB2 component (pilin)